MSRLDGQEEMTSNKDREALRIKGKVIRAMASSRWEEDTGSLRLATVVGSSSRSNRMINPTGTWILTQTNRTQIRNHQLISRISNSHISKGKWRLNTIWVRLAAIHLSKFTIPQEEEVVSIFLAAQMIM